MNIKECKTLLKLLEQRANQRVMLAQINAQPDEVRVDMTLTDHNGTGTRVGGLVPKGILQQGLINRIRETEAQIRKYGVEPT